MTTVIQIIQNNAVSSRVPANQSIPSPQRQAHALAGSSPETKNVQAIIENGSARIFTKVNPDNPSALYALGNETVFIPVGCGRHGMPRCRSVVFGSGINRAGIVQYASRTFVEPVLRIYRRRSGTFRKLSFYEMGNRTEFRNRRHGNEAEFVAKMIGDPSGNFRSERVKVLAVPHDGEESERIHGLFRGGFFGDLGFYRAFDAFQSVVGPFGRPALNVDDPRHLQRSRSGTLYFAFPGGKGPKPFFGTVREFGVAVGSPCFMCVQFS